jgi:hypothetical protein
METSSQAVQAEPHSALSRSGVDGSATLIIGYSCVR